MTTKTDFGRGMMVGANATIEYILTELANSPHLTLRARVLDVLFRVDEKFARDHQEVYSKALSAAKNLPCDEDEGGIFRDGGRVPG